MAIAYVRDLGEISTNGSTQTSSGSFGTLPAVENTIIAGGSDWYSGQTNGAMSYGDNQGNAWKTDQQLSDRSGGTGRAIASVASGRVVTSAGTFTVTADASGTSNTYYSWTAIEFSGVRGQGFDQSAANLADAGTSATSVTAGPTATLSEDEAVVVSASAINSTQNLVSITASGYTAIVDVGNGALNIVGGLGYKIVTSPAGVSAAWSWTGALDASSSCAVVVATYRAGGPYGPGSIPPPVTRPRMFAPGLAR